MDTWLTLSLAALCAIYYLYVPNKTLMQKSFRHIEDTKRPYPEDVWKEHGYAALPHGDCHYYLCGPVDGERIVVVHGINVTAVGMTDMLYKLADQGFRVLAYDIYGRGYSDSPGMTNNDAFLAGQLSHLLIALNWFSQPFNVIGYSLGGAIAVKFASVYPEHIEKITLIAPAGILKRLPAPGYILRVPILGDLFMYTVGKYIIEYFVKKQTVIESNEQSMLNRNISLSHPRSHPGFLRAYASTALSFPLCGMEPLFSKVGQIYEDRVMCVWGELDGVCPFALVPVFEGLMPNAKIIRVENSSHAVVVEEPELLACEIGKFFSRAK